MKTLSLKMLVRVPWVNVPWYQIQVQFLSQALPSLTPFSMKMRQTTWLSVQPMH